MSFRALWIRSTVICIDKQIVNLLQLSTSCAPSRGPERPEGRWTKKYNNNNNNNNKRVVSTFLVFLLSWHAIVKKVA